MLGELHIVKGSLITILCRCMVTKLLQLGGLSKNKHFYWCTVNQLQVFRGPQISMTTAFIKLSALSSRREGVFFIGHTNLGHCTYSFLHHAVWT